MYDANSWSDRTVGRIGSGEVVDFQLDREGAKYAGIELWFDGECPCDEPPGELGHLRWFWPAEEPHDPEHVGVY